MLANAFRGALQEIEFAENSDEYELEGVCDAIQVGGLCGGKYGDANRPFVFSYYYDDGNRNSRPWHIALNIGELKSIASGHQKTIEFFKCDDPMCNFHTNDSAVLCDDCDYWDDPNFGNFEFPSAIGVLSHFGVGNISEKTSLEGICSILGVPSNSGGDKHTETLGYVHPWIVYKYENYNLHFQFTADKTQIKLLTVQEPDWDR